jgi:hypothetical protein
MADEIVYDLNNLAAIRDDPQDHYLKYWAVETESADRRLFCTRLTQRPFAP